MRKVYAYSDIEDLKDSEFYEFIISHPMINASGDLSRGVTFKFFDDLYFRPIDFKKFFDNVCPLWESKYSKMTRRALSSKFFDRSMDDADVEELRDLENCRRNRASMIDGIELLTESAISYDDLGDVSGDRSLMIFSDLWKYVQENDPSMNDLSDGIDALSIKDVADRVMESSFEGYVASTEDHIVIAHGFYYITPLEERVLCALEMSGYEIVMLANYDRDHRYANEIWRVTFSDPSIYPPEEEWICVGRSSNPLGDILENRDPTVKGQISFKEYRTVLEFIDDVRDGDMSEYQLYSADRKGSDDILKEYYPEEYEKRRLLAYPIGQFIYLIHTMWDDNKRCIEITIDSICRCFASGWLSSNGKGSRELMLDLSRILPYFSDCKTVDDWSERVKRLDSVMKDVVGNFIVFDKDDRWGNIMSNPFPNIGAFSVDDENIRAILDIIKKLLDMCSNLFSDTGEISISEHLDRLKSMLEDEQGHDLLSEERDVMESIFGKLKPPEEEITFMPGDISGAIQYYLDDSLDDGDLREEKHGLVNPLSQADASKFNERKKIHLVLSDIDRLPGADKHFVWPLTEDMVKGIYGNMSGDRRIYVGDLLNIMSTSVLARRYCTYRSFDAEDLLISWIHEIDGKILQPTPYYRLVNESAGIGVDKLKDNSVNVEMIRKVKPVQMVGTDMDVWFGSDISEEAGMEYSLCSLKYVYGYLLDDRPTYSSEFMWPFAISGLISAVGTIYPDKEKAEKEVMALFPELLDIERRDICEKRSSESNDISEYKDHHITKLRFMVEFPLAFIRKEALSRFTDLGASSEHGLKLFEPSAIKGVCKYCQHTEYCRQAIFSLDQDGYYGK